MTEGTFFGHIDDPSEIEVQLRIPNKASGGYSTLWIRLTDLAALITLLQQGENPPTLPKVEDKQL